jgi:pyruvate/2-oxoglutarate dehydrogenase complex dihydrolipoamide acyltransferase (E2) component
VSERPDPNPDDRTTPPVLMNYHAGDADDVDVTDPRDGVVRSVIFAVAAVVLVLALLVALGKMAKDYLAPQNDPAKPTSRKTTTAVAEPASDRVTASDRRTNVSG